MNNSAPNNRFRNAQPDAHDIPHGHAFGVPFEASQSAANAAQKAPAGGRLGKYRKLGDAFGVKPLKTNQKTDSKSAEKRREKERNERRRNRYADQRHAAKIWKEYNPEKQGEGAGKGVIGCG